MTNSLLQQKFNQILDDDILNEIFQSGVFKAFKKDDIIIDINQSLNFIPLLLTGTIKILREDAHGDELLLYFLEAGDTCAMSMTCCLKTSKSNIRAVAESDSSLILIPVSKIQHWFNTNQSWRNFILEAYQIRFNEMLETIDTLAFMKMDERVFKYLIDKVKLNASTSLEIKHNDIADDLHTSRVVISRILKQLENESKIKLMRNKIEVLQF
ncbi:MAG: Crp/Fnr family transcriptional regulator [Flavobacteriales bacterium]|nr:Crp/Fnr family transcriptional regulator [Flavobacteriia bacterium]NCP06493.1 Crp/Fnr family transcriptional regulator [Flavobacteriales bacterium]PIV94434.1 MAG: Crp/Fnr family transcriptional regulator [Flavobacteriaceae bacterium CG17_big_fil_post_rev_8_21_14_2_50_33_15]PIY10427.1 MAG: Crp/Fnr family transcriptional regulator [Flavobacteriaceae bacterium CG_4_10_14_3_um_filter_33_47]PJB17615.1 MAG: Crp/Fnr family transcriptional regulator [Flavobacteriaceae bacterium CG_4_9_14_3_um_filter